MPTRSNLHYSVDAESLDAALQHSARAPLTPTVNSALSPSIVLPSSSQVSTVLSTTLEQTFKILSEYSKSEYQKWHPTFASYQTQGGVKSLAICMEPIVQNAFIYSLKIPQPTFFTTSSNDLHLLIHSHFQLDVVEDYCVLLVPMSSTDTFNERSCDLYISHVINILVMHPNIFETSKGGICQKFFTKHYVDGIFPTTLRADVRKKGPNTIDDAMTYLREQYKRYNCHNNISKAMHTTPSPKSFEGKIADNAISEKSISTLGSCPNCKLFHGSYKYCKLPCTLCPRKPSHNFFTKNICNSYLSWETKKKKNGSWREPKSANNANITVSSPPSDPSDLATIITALNTLTTAYKSNVSNNKRLLIDSGCNANIIASPLHSDIPIIYRDSKEGISTANGEVIPILGQGTVLNVPADFVPSFVDSLLSVSQMTDLKNSVFIFLKDVAYEISLTSSIIDLLTKIHTLAVHENLILCTAPITKDKLYAVNMKNTTNIHIPSFAAPTYYQSAQFDNVSDLVKYFHETWSHASLDLMVHIIKHNIFTNLPPSLTEKAIRKYFPICPSCSAGNMNRKPYASESVIQRELQPGEELIMDIKIIADNKHNSSKQSFNNNLSALTIIDNATNYKWGFPLQNHGTSSTIIEKLLIVHKEILSHGRILKFIRADAQFVTNEIQTWCNNCTPQVQLLPCIPHEHQQIGKVERFNQTWENTVIKLLANKPHLSNKYWALAYNDIIMKSNLLPMLTTTTTPYQLWTNSTDPINLDLLPMIPFGTIVMAHVPVHLQSTLHPKSIRMIAVGSSLIHQGGILLYNPLTNKVITRRTFKQIGPIDISTITPEYTVNYEEDGIPIEFPLNVTPETTINSNDFDDYKYLINTIHRDDEDQKLYKIINIDVINSDIDGDIIVGYRQHVLNNNKLDPTDTDIDVPYHINDLVKLTHSYQRVGLKASIINGSRHSPSRHMQYKIPLQYNIYSALRSCFTQPAQIVPDPDTPTDIDLLIAQSKIDNTKLRSLGKAFIPPDKDKKLKKAPRTMRELTKLDDLDPDKTGYRNALNSELESLRSMNVYNSSDLLNIDSVPQHKVGSSKLIFSKKLHPDGSFDKYKCRLVFRGDRWVDFFNNKTYSGTVRSETVRLLFSILAETDYEFQSADVRTAFLYGEVPANQDIYMSRPTGLTDADMPPVVRLRKCLYGLPMASAMFKEHCNKVLIDMGFRATISDPGLYLKQLDSGQYVYIFVHVDDFGIISPTAAIGTDIMAQMKKIYNLTTEDEVDFHLGMVLTRDRPNKTITISQPGYTEEMLTTYNIPLNINSYPLTPMSDAPRNLPSETNKLLDKKGIEDYQSKVGSLLYLANQTRPDILYAVNMHSRYTKSPTQEDVLAVHRIFLYLAGTPSLGITLHSGEGIVLYATVDASYGNHIDRKSHTGCTLHIGRHSGSFLTRSKKQTVTADSSTIAELIAAFTVTKEIMWARSLLAEIGYPQLEPTIIFEDNMSTIAMVNNDGNSQKTKHIDIRYNLTREQVKNKVITMEHLKTLDMTSDILTKPLAGTPFLHLRPLLLGIANYVCKRVHLAIRNMYPTF